MKNFENLRNEFPILQSNNIAYLDSAATSQKPQSVIDAIKRYYESANANAHRGTYKLSVDSSTELDSARKTVQKFINAKSQDEIIFTKNSTESLNLIAYSYGIDNLTADDEVVLSIMEHHSNIVPWQKICKKTGAKLNYMYLDDNFQIDKNEIESKITSKTKVVGVLSASNVLGTITPLKKIIEKAHSVGAVVIVDVTQSIAHTPFDVQKYDADFVVFSGHKMYAPTGIVVLYAKRKLLENMSPFLMGGDMIEYVYEQNSTFAELPNKFEAGTQNVAGAVGLKSAIEFILGLGYENIEKYETELRNYALKRLKELNFVTIYATNEIDNLAPVISFNINGVHPHDVASILDSCNVCVRAGNHCAQPLLRYLGLDSTVRISLAVYNTKNDIDRLIDALNKCYDMFKNYI